MTTFRPSRTARRLVLSWGLLPALVACTAVPDGAAPPSLADTAWTLQSLPGVAVLPATAPTLRIEGGQAQGSDGCNRYGAPVTAVDGRLKLGPGFATQMACPEATMQLAAKFNAALAGATAYRVEGATLTLLDGGGGTLATLVAQPTALAGTAWQVTGYNNGRQAVVSLLAGTSATLEFLEGDRLVGFAGCNRYSGSYSQPDAVSLSVGTLVSTRKGCAQPEGLMAQEAAFLRALETVATARREGQRLDLRTAGGALAVSLSLSSVVTPAVAPASSR